MRISGGQARGIRLAVPKGDAVRPATDGMRQAVFSSLAVVVEGAWFVDLFAGSGAYGLEALSRGAAGGCWVEQHGPTAASLRKNVDAVCRSLRRDRSGLEVRVDDALRGSWSGGLTRCDIVFADPPYDQAREAGEAVFATIDRELGANWDGWVVLEIPGEIEVAPLGWRCRKRIGKGVRQPTVAIFERDPAPPRSG